MEGIYLPRLNLEDYPPEFLEYVDTQISKIFSNVMVLWKKVPF